MSGGGQAPHPFKWGKGMLADGGGRQQGQAEREKGK